MTKDEEFLFVGQRISFCSHTDPRGYDYELPTALPGRKVATAIITDVTAGRSPVIWEGTVKEFQNIKEWS